MGDQAETGDAGVSQEGGEVENLFDTSSSESGEQQAQDTVAERPEYIKEQFWDAEKGEPNLEALAKSQADFERMARSKRGDVPSNSNDYEFKPKDGVELDESDEGFIAKTKEIAMANGLTKEAYQGFMEALTDTIAESGAEAFDAQAEMKKLGKNAGEIINAVTTWADNLVNVGLLSDNERQALNAMGATPDGIATLNKIRTHYTRTNEIPMQINSNDGAMSKEEYYSAVGSEKYSSDPAYRRKIQDQARRIFGVESAGSSPSGFGV